MGKIHWPTTVSEQTTTALSDLAIGNYSALKYHFHDRVEIANIRAGLVLLQIDDKVVKNVGFHVSQGSS